MKGGIIREESIYLFKQFFRFLDSRASRVSGAMANHHVDMYWFASRRPLYWPAAKMIRRFVAEKILFRRRV